MASRRRGGRFTRQGVDFRCRGSAGMGRHDKRAGLLWVDVLAPGVLFSRLPGGRELPAGATTAVLGCPVCARRVEVDVPYWHEVLVRRAADLGPSTFEVPLHWVFWRGGEPGVRPLGPGVRSWQ